MLIKKITPKACYYLAWIQSLVAMVMSLYFSEILHWPPCTLCWYQRILMYPLVILIPLGIMQKDSRLYAYVLSLSIPGILVATYHTLLQMGVVESITTCTAGVSCETDSLNLFGFITIPMLSLAGFIFITIVMYLAKKQTPDSTVTDR